jgi:hypothetical protein
MSTHLSRHFERLRLERALRLGQLAGLMGCSNHSKIGGRIRQFEITGHISQELLKKLMAVLDVEDAVVEQLLAADHREYLEKWLDWVNSPIQPYLLLRIMAAIYQKEPIPEALTQEQAESYTSTFTKKNRKMCCLVWSRRLSVWFDSDGVVYDRTEAVPGVPNTTCSRVGSKSFLFAGDLSRVASMDLPPKKISPFDSGTVKRNTVAGNLRKASDTIGRIGLR